MGYLQKLSLLYFLFLHFLYSTCVSFTPMMNFPNWSSTGSLLVFILHICSLSFSTLASSSTKKLLPLLGAPRWLGQLSDYWFWLRSSSKGHGIKTHVEPHVNPHMGQAHVCLSLSLTLCPSPYCTCAWNQSLKKNNSCHFKFQDSCMCVCLCVCIYCSVAFYFFLLFFSSCCLFLKHPLVLWMSWMQ